MQDIVGRTIAEGNWLLYRVSSEHGPGANWTIRKVDSVDENAQKITLVGVNKNPASNEQPSGTSTISYRTTACPRRFLLVLDPGNDTLYQRERQDVPLIDLGLRPQ